MKADGGYWAGGKCPINDGGGIVGNVNECWREAKDGNRSSCVIVASTSTGGMYCREGIAGLGINSSTLDTGIPSSAVSSVGCSYTGCLTVE